jgi:hypothetical protein
VLAAAKAVSRGTSPSFSCAAVSFSLLIFPASCFAGSEFVMSSPADAVWRMDHATSLGLIWPKAGCASIA